MLKLHLSSVAHLTDSIVISRQLAVRIVYTRSLCKVGEGLLAVLVVHTAFTDVILEIQENSGSAEKAGG